MKKTAIILAVFVLVAGCGGKKEVKTVSYESRIYQEAISVVEALRVAYLKKDFSAISEKATKQGYSEIMGSVRHFDSAELTFTPNWVSIEQPKVFLNASWKGSWTVGTETFRERGTAVFILEGKPLRLSRISRGNPFKYPER